MVVRRTSYPQVDPRAVGLMSRAVAVVPRHLPIEEAARLGRRRHVRLLVARVGSRWGGVTPATLEQALRLGLHRIAVGAVLWGMPLVEPRTPEVAVRRKLGAANPFALVVGPEGPVGAVLFEGRSGDALPLSISEALARLPDTVLRILRQAGALGDERGWAVVVVGGLVRDLLLGRLGSTRIDLDLTVEGDAPALARQLAVVLGGNGRERVREHPAFLTATVTVRDGERIDVTTARREHYPAPGALPDVEPATITIDLWRRDFSLNALAVRLNSGEWGQLLDPAGGLADLRRRRIRVLHPLSFVEDPTRMFRAIRYATRLGFTLEATTRHLFSQATRLRLDAVSGDRLRAEIRLVLREPAPVAGLARLGRMGAFRLLLPGYRFRVRAGRLLRRAAECTRAFPLARDTSEGLYVLALTAHLAPDGVTAWVTRLGLPGAMRRSIERARSEAAQLLPRLAAVGGPTDAYIVLRGIPELVLAWAHVCACRAATRRHIAEHLQHWRHVRPFLTGDDLRALGVNPGPALGRLLEDLRVAQVGGRIRHRRDAAAWARRAVARLRTPGRSSSTNRTRPGRRGG